MQRVSFPYLNNRFMLKIATWNSQGSPSNSSAKIEILEFLYNRFDIILLQECGNFSLDVQGGTMILEDATLTDSLHAGAFNVRCNSCIISKKRVRAITSHYLSSGVGRFVAGVHVESEGINVYNIHATAQGGGAADVTSVLSSLTEPFILGGDMNCTPEELRGGGRSQNRSLLVGTSSRGRQFEIARTGSNTRGGREYDFFIHSQNLSHRNVDRYTLKGGDHFPVYAEFDFIRYH